MNEKPIIGFLPIEHEIKIQQQNYHDVLDKYGKEAFYTVFVEFMLEKIKTLPIRTSTIKNN